MSLPQRFPPPRRGCGLPEQRGFTRARLSAASRLGDGLQVLRRQFDVPSFRSGIRRDLDAIQPAPADAQVSSVLGDDPLDSPRAIEKGYVFALPVGTGAERGLRVADPGIHVILLL